MSMILDALTRAEHERQIENQPDLKFVTPVKQRQKKFNNAWLWAALALIANIVILAIFLRPDSRPNETTEIATNNIENSDADYIIQAPAPTPVVEEIVEPEVVATSPIDEDEATIPASSPVDRPLAMELDNKEPPELDRPLIYEAKQAKKSQRATVAQNPVTEQVAVASPAKKGAVAFSQEELNVDEGAQAIKNAPKLLIDQGEAEPSISSVPSLKDLPDSSRNSLSGYEVNVHVFDDNPERRFVLINMGKYKEGDRIADNGPLVEEITREGVIVDYGSGRALLPPK